MKTAQHRVWLRTVSLAAPAALLVHAVVASLVPLGFDATPFFVPLARLASSLLAQGDWPTWTERIGFGFPLAASAQLPLLYPPAWPMFLVEDPARVLSAYLALHACWAAAGGWAMARAWRLNAWACAFSAVASGASLPVLSLLNRPEFMVAQAWLPWIMSAAAGGNALRFGAFTGCCALVSPQMAVAGALVAWVALRPRLHVVDVTASFLAASAWLWVPFLGLLAASDRASAVDAVDAGRFGLGWTQWAQFLVPTAAGVIPGAGDVVSVARTSWVAGTVPGVTTTLLVLLLVGVRSVRWPLLCVVAVLLVSSTEALPWMGHAWRIPPLGLVRFPAKAWCAVLPMVILLAARALTVVARSRVPAWVLVAPVVVVAVGATSGAKGTGWALAMTAAWCAAAGFIKGRQHRVVAVAAVACVETLVMGSAAMEFSPVPPSDGPPAVAARAAVAGRAPRVTAFPSAGNPVQAATDMSRAERAAFGHHGAWFATSVEQGMAMDPAMTGIRLAGPQRIHQVLLNDVSRRTAATGADMMLVGSEFPVPEGMNTRAAWPELGVKLLDTAGDHERVRVARRVHPARDEAELAVLLARADIDLANEAIVIGDTGDAPNPATVTMMMDHSRHAQFRVAAQGRALVWTRDALAPGWRVKVDGVESAAVAVHGAWRGTWVPAGDHVVQWEYRPMGFVAGAALALSAACVAWMRRRSVRRRDEHG